LEILSHVNYLITCFFLAQITRSWPLCAQTIPWVSWWCTAILEAWWDFHSFIVPDLFLYIYFLNSWCKKYVKYHLIVCLCFFVDTPVSSKYTALGWELCYVHLGRNPQYQHLMLLCLWSDLTYICSGQIWIIYICVCSGRIWIVNLIFFLRKNVL